MQVDLRHIDQSQGRNRVDVGIDLSEFYLSVEWDLLEVPAVRNEEFYSCCSESYTGELKRFKCYRIFSLKPRINIVQFPKTIVFYCLSVMFINHYYTLWFIILYSLYHKICIKIILCTYYIMMIRVWLWVIWQVVRIND